MTKDTPNVAKQSASVMQSNGNGTSAMEPSDIDPDTVTRSQALEAAMWLADTTEGVEVTSADDLLMLATQIEFWLTEGATIAFDCKEDMRKFVRGE
jgi:translation elongation factor P/translation initiation factor 5A